MRNIGISVKPPRKTCEDPICPFHGTLPVRGRLIKGKAVSVKAKGIAVVEREFLHFVKKYLRYEKRRSRFSAHLPPCIPLKEGEEVTIAECRPVSKTVSFVVVEVSGAE